MSDLFHQWGADLVPATTGDLSLAQGSVLSGQRVLRRLLTNLNDYIWQPQYGSGLGGFVGQPVSAAQIAAVIRSQIFKEATVARSPEPVIQVSSNGPSGVYVQISYTETTSGQPQILTFSLPTQSSP
jgi:phage baseplate assembly protein W